MNSKDLALLLAAGNDLGDAFQHNRDRRTRVDENALDRAMREREGGLDRGLRREELGLRREDAADARGVRKQALESQTAHQQRIEKYQQALAQARDDDAKFGILGKMNEEGLLTDEGVNLMSEEINKKFGKAGIGVKLFKLGTGVRQKDAPYAEIEEPLGEPDPLTGKAPGSIKRRIPESEVGGYLQNRGQAVAAEKQFKRDDAAEGPTPEQEAEMEAILGTAPQPAHGPPPGKADSEQRVNVISPDGKRGSIPRSQLKAALAKGFKQVQ